MKGNASLYLLAMLAVSGAVTILLRALPFLAFGSGRKPPRMVEVLGKVLAPGAIAILVVYCFCGHLEPGEGETLASHGFGVAEAAAGAVVILFHAWRRNPMLSILSGTIAYMALLRVFGN